MIRILVVIVLLLIATACNVVDNQTRTSGTVEESLTARNSLHKSIREGIEETSARKEIDMGLQVSGGSPAEAYLLDLRVSGDGRATYKYFDKLISDKEYQGETNLQDDAVVALLEKVLETQVLELPENEPQFAPGTTVGKLEIADGTSTFQIYFAADEEQAASQGKVPPQELTEFIESLYRLGSDLVVDAESVKP